MIEDKRSFVAKCLSDFEFFGKTCLKIRDKSGAIKPFELNDSQKVLHARLEQQREERGWVRALVLKGRQQGISTYTAARFYKRASTQKGVNVYILSHEQQASDNLFGIVDRYQRNNPIAPHVGTSNIKELVFDRLDSSYTVATAATKAGGRSRAVSLFHGSEVAFWPNAADHFAASIQAVPLFPGTEIILESTSAGATGEFYERWQRAEIGEGDYIPIFLPWFLEKSNSRDPDFGFQLSDEAAEGDMSEKEYADTFKLSLPQMAWRRSKVSELGLVRWKREYPAYVEEAWQMPDDHEPFIKPIWVMRARKRPKTEPSGPLILGVDPASLGGDRFSVAARRGNAVLWVRYRNKIDHNEGTAWVKSLIDELKPVRVNIDTGNIGVAIVTNLKSLGPRYAEVVRGVNFGATSEAKTAKPKTPGPANRRAEMWQRSNDWLMSEECPQIPDDNALQSDATGPRMKPRLNGDFVLESKEDMRKRGVRSPDMWDSVALTFAHNEYFANYAEAPQIKSFSDIDTPRQSSVTLDYLPAGPTAWMG